MPKEITNYLTQGQPSKIYLLCFIQPRTGYALAKEIHGQPLTAKIYGWAKEMMAEGYLEKDQHGYRAVIKPLLSELEAILKEKGECLDFHEKKLLVRILESHALRKSVSGAYESWRKRTPHIVSLVSEFLSNSAVLVLNIKKIGDEETDITAAQALKSFSAKADVDTLADNNPGIQLLNEVMYSHLEKMGMHQRAGMRSTHDGPKEYAEFSIFAGLPSKFLLKLSKLGINSQYLTYMFALILGIDRVLLMADMAGNLENKAKSNNP